MFPAVLAAVLFACSAVVSQRTARIFGAVPGHFYRMTLACVVLGLVTWAVDAARGTGSLHAETCWRFLVSGAVGYGIGDIALFLAYNRLGSRFTILINWCSAALFAAGGDWLLRGQGLTLAQGLAVTGILAGLVIALWPADPAQRAHHPASGIIFAAVSGIATGIATVLSGEAIDTARAMSVEIPAVSQTFQRSVAGVAAAGAAFLLVKYYFPQRRKEEKERKWRHKRFWLLSAALCGPVLGVSCYQWALNVTGSSTIVVAIAATSTLLVIPLARLVEKDIPRGRQLAGSLLAAAGVVALQWFG